MRHPVNPAPAPLPDLPEVPAAGLLVVLCEDCDRPLTGRAAKRGVGDRCRHKRGERDIRGPGRFDVPQDTLPGA